MEQCRLRTHQAQKRTLVVFRDYRRIFAATLGGRAMLAALKRAVSAQTSRYAAQEQYRIDQKTAADRGRKARRSLYVGLRHVAVVSRVVTREDDRVPVFDKPAWTSDATLIALAEAVVGAVSPHEELFVNAGLQHGFLAALAGEIAALKKAKDGVTRARARFTETTVAFDRALDEGRAAIAVLDGIRVSSKDVPMGKEQLVEPPRVVQIALYFDRLSRGSAGRHSTFESRSAKAALSVSSVLAQSPHQNTFFTP